MGWYWKYDSFVCAFVIVFSSVVYDWAVVDVVYDKRKRDRADCVCVFLQKTETWVAIVRPYFKSEKTISSMSFRFCPDNMLSARVH